MKQVGPPVFDLLNIELAALLSSVLDLDAVAIAQLDQTFNWNVESSQYEQMSVAEMVINPMLAIKGYLADIQVEMAGIPKRNCCVMWKANYPEIITNDKTSKEKNWGRNWKSIETSNPRM